MALRCSRPFASLGLRRWFQLNAPYRSGPSKTWIKVKNPKAPAATQVIDGTFDVFGVLAPHVHLPDGPKARVSRW